MAYGNVRFAASLLKTKRIMKKLLLIILIFAGLTGFKHSNTRHITGTVYGADDRLPIVGAAVAIKGTKIGVVTDVNGRYTVNVPDGKVVLVFSYLSYQTKTVTIGKNDTVDIYLQPLSTSLNEVVVTGYQTQRKKDYTGSVATVDMSSANAVSSSNAPSILRGQAAGVSAQYYKAAPGAASAVKIKGLSSYPAATPVNDESYANITENGFTTVSSTPLSTFSVDVDAASYSNVRRFINQGQMPPANAVRIEEMINYFHYNLPAPTDGGPVAIHTELSAAPWNTKHRLLRIGLKAKTIDAQKLPPSNLVFLIDVSGSMFQDNKLPLVKSSMKMLVEWLL